jgi:hypothetical protein
MVDIPDDGGGARAGILVLLTVFHAITGLINDSIKSCS